MSSKKNKKNSDYHYSQKRDAERRSVAEKVIKEKEQKKRIGYMVSAIVAVAISITCSLLDSKGVFPQGDFVADAFASTSFFLLWYFYKDNRKGVSTLCAVFGVVTAVMTIYTGSKLFGNI